MSNTRATNTEVMIWDPEFYLLFWCSLYWNTACCFLPQSFSSEPSGQSSVPSQSFSAGRQMVESLAHTWWESLHTSASQLSSSELSSQSLSPSHIQALLIQRATGKRQGNFNDKYLNRLYILYILLNLKYGGLLTRVPAAKLDCWVAHVCDTLTVLLITQVHAVSVPITAPTQGDAQPIHPTLKLICMTTSRRTSGCREERQYTTLNWHCSRSSPALIKSGRTALSTDNVQLQRIVKTITNERSETGWKQVLATGKAVAKIQVYIQRVIVLVWQLLVTEAQ